MVKIDFSFLGSISSEFSSFCQFFFLYLKKKVISISNFFEENKNTLVKLFTIKRGRYNRPFMHLTAMAVLGIGVMVSPFLAETYPIFSPNKGESLQIGSPATQQSIIVGANVFQTDISQKPRDKIIEYTVGRGDTLSTIAEKFGISVETIRWTNDLTSDSISVNDTLKILPVTGLSYKVEKGDTVYSIAKKLDTDAQKIVDFPFNDFANPETFALVEGQTLMVPDGVKPSEQPTIRRQVYIASGPTSFSTLGFTWPAHGIVSQFASWYHMALDITGSIGAPIVVAHSGVVSHVSSGVWDGGYGTNVSVENGDVSTLYAHLSGVNVAIGQEVQAGSTVLGWIGMTGRTTGPHVHFEIRKGGVLVNPLPYLQ
ncbi:M23 family metallopeptidase [Candidatus Roizmanbacteria bacterium]|nr:M23 family metallopeptidase [Candidatus Roizmanbacteria bacterium]